MRIVSGQLLRMLEGLWQLGGGGSVADSAPERLYLSVNEPAPIPQPDGLGLRMGMKSLHLVKLAGS